jgi:GTP pyrophosphokinase
MRNTTKAPIPAEKTVDGINLNNLILEIKRYMPDFNERRFTKAFEFAANAHSGQARKDGTPYITHPVEATRILTTLHVDEDTLIAALLHDVPEDTEKTIEDIDAAFGKKVAFLVDGITKLAKVHYQHDMEQRQIESLKKLFLHTAKDPRIIIIKLADRLHNMRTLHFITKEQKRVRISRETLEIFVPIANLLGIEELKAELEDLCFKYLFPDEYATISERMKRTREKNKKYLDETQKMVDEALRAERLQAMVYGRHRHLYGIYKELISSGKRLDEFDEIISLRILVQEKDDCYKALGVIHSLYKPRPGKFKDYIAVPKMNGYQSLHTVVFGLNGLSTEFQIRTNTMHLDAEYGVAAHYFSGSTKSKKSLLEEDKRSTWIEKIIQMQKKESANAEFIQDLKLDVFKDRIFVFTPKGRAIDLPEDATCIDFAYHVHTDIGHRALKAEVNGQMVPLATPLQNGDTVRIIVSDFMKGPSRSWLPFAKTTAAKNRIRDYFKHASRDARLNSGRTILQKELDRAGLGLLKNLSFRKTFKYLKKHTEYKAFDDVLIAIGEGSITAIDFLSELYPNKTATVGVLGYFERFFRWKRKEQITPVAIKIVSRDGVGQLEKILKIVSSLQLNALVTKAYLTPIRKDFICKQILAINNFSQISELFQNLEQIEGIRSVQRLFWQRRLFFIFSSIVTFGFWVAHPFVLHELSTTADRQMELNMSTLIMYGGLFMLFIMVLLLKRVTVRSFPELRETVVLWTVTFMMTFVAAVTLVAEVLFFNINFNWLIGGGMFIGIVAYLLKEFLQERSRAK